MNLNANRPVLLEALNLCMACVPSRTPKPILRGVRMETSQSKLRLFTTDLEKAIAHDVTMVQVEAEGVCVVAAEDIRDILREMTDDSVKITAQAGELRISGQDSSFLLHTLAAEEYPPFPKPPEPIATLVITNETCSP